LQALILQELESTTFDELAREAVSVVDVAPVSTEQVKA
jgi:hypothetical protein